MPTYAFVGERRAPPAAKPGFAARLPRALGALAIGAALVAGCILGSRVTPFHYADALAVTGVATLPALVVIASFFVRDNGLPSMFVPSGAFNTLRAVAALLIAAVLLPGNLLLYANERLDTSPAVIETVLVTDARISRGRYTGESYIVGIATNVESPLGGYSFYDSQPIAIPRNDWTTILPGRTHLVLREHRGFFRLPWFEPNPARAR